jgi:hypothetical protein
MLKPKPKPSYGGWSPALNRWQDQTGTCHYLKGTPRGTYLVYGAACSYRGYLSGATWGKREDCERATGTHACRTCLRVERAHPPTLNQKG